jgi:hypothetical protein
MVLLSITLQDCDLTIAQMQSVRLKTSQQGTTRPFAWRRVVSGSSPSRWPCADRVVREVLIDRGSELLRFA